MLERNIVQDIIHKGSQCLPLNKMDARGSLNNPANLTRLQGKGRILEFFLHFAVTEKSAGIGS